MGILDIFKKKKPVKVEEAPPKAKKKTAKEIATEKGEPYIEIVSMDVDPENLHQGAFELDWNDKFVANLVRAGYQGKPTDTDAEIVDRWFRDLASNMLAEAGQDPSRHSAGFINVNRINPNQSEVS
mgnify:CR=1 FL=1